MWPSYIGTELGRNSGCQEFWSFGTLHFEFPGPGAPPLHNSGVQPTEFVAIAVFSVDPAAILGGMQTQVKANSIGCQLSFKTNPDQLTRWDLLSKTKLKN